MGHHLVGTADISDLASIKLALQTAAQPMQPLAILTVRQSYAGELGINGGSSIIRRFDSPKVLRFFSLTLLQMLTQSPQFLSTRVRARVMVSENACCSKHFRNIKRSDYKHVTGINGYLILIRGV